MSGAPISGRKALLLAIATVAIEGYDLSLYAVFSVAIARARSSGMGEPSASRAGSAPSRASSRSAVAMTWTSWVMRLGWPEGLTIRS